MRRKTILTTAALMAVCATPASAADEYQDVRASDRGPYVLERDYGSPDAADAATDTSPVPVGAPGVYRDSERKLVESPEVQQMQQRLSREIREIRAIRATTAVVEVRGPSGGFDWGDAGIGAAGMLALLCIAGGSALLLTSTRRRRDVSATVH